MQGTLSLIPVCGFVHSGRRTDRYRAAVDAGRWIAERWGMNMGGPVVFSYCNVVFSYLNLFAFLTCLRMLMLDQNDDIWRRLKF
jgi:hypothetical protein